MLTGILAGLAAGALWGLVFVAPRMVAGYTSVDLTAGRFVAYGVVAAALMLLVMRGRPLPTLRQALAALGMSVLGFTGYYLLLVLAIRDAGTEVPTLVIGTILIFGVLRPYLREQETRDHRQSTEYIQSHQGALRQIYVRAQNGTSVPLSTLVRPTKSAAALSVNHQGQFTAVTISFNAAPGCRSVRPWTPSRRASASCRRPSAMRWAGWAHCAAAAPWPATCCLSPASCRHWWPWASRTPLPARASCWPFWPAPEDAAVR